MTIKIYLDEDAQDGDFVTALKFRGVDVLTSNEAGMNGCDDLKQLKFAAQKERVRTYARRILTDGFFSC